MSPAPWPPAIHESLFHPFGWDGSVVHPFKERICPKADRTLVRPFPPIRLQPKTCTQNHAQKTCKGFTFKSMKACERLTLYSIISVALYSLPVLPGEVTQVHSFPYTSVQCKL